MAGNISKKPIELKEGVNIQLDGNLVKVTGPKGELVAKIPENISVEIVDGKVIIKKNVEVSNSEMYAGLSRALISNMVTGVTAGFKKNLELSGVGYRAKVEGKDLVLNVGFANAVRITPPEGIEISVAEGIITVSGIDKAKIGDLASKIREVRIPDPYKAKGIKYAGEHIRRKVGKAAKAVGAAK